MVATLARLRLTLLRNTLTREKWRIILLVLGGLYGLGILALAVAGLALLNAADDSVRTTVMVLGGSALVLGWTVIPVLAFGIDNTLDPQRFALFLTPSRQFAIGLLVAGAVSVPGAVTVLVCLASSVAWVTAGSGLASVLAVLAALVMGALAAVLCLLLARVSTTAASGLLRGRRGRDMAAIAGVVVLLAVSVLPSLLGSASWNLESFATLVTVLAWTPFGAPWAVPGDVVAGDWLLALARVAVVAATLALAGVAYVRLLHRSMTTVGSDGGSSVERSTRLPFATSLMARGVKPEVAAIAGRSLRYWRGDPRYLTQVVSIAILPLLALVFAYVAGTSEESGLDVGETLGWAVLGLGPIVAWMGAWCIHDDVAYDSSAFWLHIAAGVKGEDDRRGRLLGIAVWLVPVAVLLAIVAPAAAGRVAFVPAVLGLTVALLGAGLGLSAVMSVLVPYPVPPPGANPMSTQSGGAGITIVAQLVSFAVLGVLVVPTAATMIPVFASDPAWGWLTLVVGAATAWLFVAVGIRWGGRLYDRRAVAVLTQIRSWPKH